MQELSRFFNALGDETRLRLVALLTQQEPGSALCVGRLAHELGVTTSAVSQHLRVLKDLGLVHGERRGYRIHYFLDEERLASYQALTREHLGERFVPGATEPSTIKGGEGVCSRDENRSCCPEKPKPEECTPEKIWECHGDGMGHPCEQKKPEECTPEQIRECHGEEAGHPCEQDA